MLDTRYQKLNTIYYVPYTTYYKLYIVHDIKNCMEMTPSNHRSYFHASDKEL